MQTVVIDVREPSEFAIGHVAKAINIPLQEILQGSDKLSIISKDTPIVAYCRSGNRSAIAVKSLSEQGFSNATNGINQQTVEAQLA